MTAGKNKCNKQTNKKRKLHTNYRQIKVHDEVHDKNTNVIKLLETW